MAGTRKLLGQVLITSAIIIFLVSVYLYSQGRGRLALTAVGATLTVLGFVALAGQRHGGSSS